MIKIATSNAARALRRNDLGVIAAGKRADLVILAKNPLDDIANTRSIVMVIASLETPTGEGISSSKKEVGELSFRIPLTWIED